jgi:hypothetical protein
MNMRLFFLKHDGWFEAELTEKLLHATAEDLIRWAYAVMERNHYRNYRITEGPHPLTSLGAGTGEGERQKSPLKAGFPPAQIAEEPGFYASLSCSRFGGARPAGTDEETEGSKMWKTPGSYTRA